MHHSCMHVGHHLHTYIPTCRSSHTSMFPLRSLSNARKASRHPSISSCVRTMPSCRLCVCLRRLRPFPSRSAGGLICFQGETVKKRQANHGGAQFPPVTEKGLTKKIKQSSDARTRVVGASLYLSVPSTECLSNMPKRLAIHTMLWWDCS